MLDQRRDHVLVAKAAVQVQQGPAQILDPAGLARQYIRDILGKQPARHGSGDQRRTVAWFQSSSQNSAAPSTIEASPKKRICPSARLAIRLIATRQACGENSGTTPSTTSTSTSAVPRRSS